MSSMIKGVDRATQSAPYAPVEALRPERVSGERPISRDPAVVPEVSDAQGAKVSNALERFQDKVLIETVQTPAKRTEMETPLELLSVQVLADLKRAMRQIAPHEPKEHLITITLKAVQGDGLKAQVTRVSSSGVATDLDLIGQGPEADRFLINGAPIRNSLAQDDSRSFEANAQSAIAKAAAINASSKESGVRAVALPTRTDTQQSLNEELGGEVYGVTHPVRGFRPQQDAQLVINGVDVGLKIFADRDETGELQRAINSVTSQTGVTGSLNEEGELVLEAPDGRNISVQYDGPKGAKLEDAIGLRSSGQHPYGGRIAMVSFREVFLDLGREVNYSLGDIAGDFSVKDETYYSH